MIYLIKNLKKKYDNLTFLLPWKIIFKRIKIKLWVNYQEYHLFLNTKINLTVKADTKVKNSKSIKILQKLLIKKSLQHIKDQAHVVHF
jgi:hypothetical protein